MQIFKISIPKYLLPTPNDPKNNSSRDKKYGAGQRSGANDPDPNNNAYVSTGRRWPERATETRGAQSPVTTSGSPSNEGKPTMMPPKPTTYVRDVPNHMIDLPSLSAIKMLKELGGTDDPAPEWENYDSTHKWDPESQNLGSPNLESVPVSIPGAYQIKVLNIEKEEASEGVKPESAADASTATSGGGPRAHQKDGTTTNQTTPHQAGDTSSILQSSRAQHVQDDTKNITIDDTKVYDDRVKSGVRKQSSVGEVSTEYLTHKPSTTIVQGGFHTRDGISTAKAGEHVRTDSEKDVSASAANTESVKDRERSRTKSLLKEGDKMTPWNRREAELRIFNSDTEGGGRHIKNKQMPHKKYSTAPANDTALSPKTGGRDVSGTQTRTSKPLSREAERRKSRKGRRNQR